MEPDFSGYATKAGLKCSDGRVIKASAFQHMNGVKVPLVWQHGHAETTNVLGHAILEARKDGVYARGFFNTTPNGLHAKNMVQHGDIDKLSIYANQLQEQNKLVSHGSIKEVSLVLAGANPGAKIDHVRIQHSDDPEEFYELDEEAIIHTGLQFEVTLEHADEEAETDAAKTEEVIEHAVNMKAAAPAAQNANTDETVEDVFQTLNPQQVELVHYLIGAALEDAASPDDNSAGHSDETDEGALAHQEGTNDMGRNVFDQNANSGQADKHTMTHDDMKSVFEDAKRRGSLKEAVEAYAAKNSLAHGITDIDVLFPDAKNTNATPEFDARRMEWVSGVLNGTHNTPFSRIKTITADITQDEARAKGYITGNYKKEEWFGVSSRTTSPTTIYKKQQLDRDDILDITDFDVVAWLRAEMRVMLDEEIARAILIGDGRDPSDDDKIKDPLGASDGVGIRSILNDHELFVTTVNANVLDANSSYDEVVDVVMDGMVFYKGTGQPTFYCTARTLNMFLKAKDSTGRRLYANKSEVADALGVVGIVTVEPMTEVPNLLGIIVNLRDYNTGTDKGGEVTMFDDFDIDYNKQKYLLETRLSGALTKIKSAVVVMSTAVGNVLVDPTKPTFVASTGVVTIPTVTGVVYHSGSPTGTTLSAGAQTALAAGNDVTIYAVPATGYYFERDDRNWYFKRPSA
jgi:HK97 family phage prohead protease